MSIVTQTQAEKEQTPDTPFDAAMERLEQVRQMLENGTLIKGEDYGIIPGMGTKPTLYKPGAQKLMAVFSLASIVRDVVRDSRFEEQQNGHKKEVVSYRVIVTLQNKLSGMTEAEGVGSCNSGERRYKSQNAADLDNTILKMARKRGLVDATLDATGASSLFTQDIEDMPRLDEEAPRPPARQRAGAAVAANGRSGGSSPRFEIPHGTPKSACRSCNAEIYWVKTVNGKNMPTNPDGSSHFDSCTNADSHRKPKPPAQQPPAAQPQVAQPQVLSPFIRDMVENARKAGYAVDEENIPREWYQTERGHFMARYEQLRRRCVELGLKEPYASGPDITDMPIERLTARVHNLEGVVAQQEKLSASNPPPAPSSQAPVSEAVPA